MPKLQDLLECLANFSPTLCDAGPERPETSLNPNVHKVASPPCKLFSAARKEGAKILDLDRGVRRQIEICKVSSVDCTVVLLYCASLVLTRV